MNSFISFSDFHKLRHRVEQFEDQLQQAVALWASVSRRLEQLEALTPRPRRKTAQELDELCGDLLDGEQIPKL